MNCPFYGHAYYAAHNGAPHQPPFVLFPSGGNQCALDTDSHAPCRMEQHGEVPDWKTCILVRSARCEEVV